MGHPQQLSTKYSVFNTLIHMVRTVCSKPELLEKGKEAYKGPFKDENISNGC